MALLCWPKLGSPSPNGFGTLVSGLPRLARSSAWFGTLSGTLRMPSMSSEKQMRREGMRSLGQHAKGVADHGGARHLAEGADVGQAGRTVAGLEDDASLRVAAFLHPLDHLARLLERPGLGAAGGGEERGIGEGGGIGGSGHQCCPGQRPAGGGTADSRNRAPARQSELRGARMSDIPRLCPGAGRPTSSPATTKRLHRRWLTG